MPTSKISVAHFSRQMISSCGREWNVIGLLRTMSPMFSRRNIPVREIGRCKSFRFALKSRPIMIEGWRVAVLIFFETLYFGKELKS
jgi:hypothetical protein